MNGDSVDVLVLGAGGPIGQALGRQAGRVGLRIGLTSRSSGSQPLDIADHDSLVKAFRASRPSAVVNLVNPRIAPIDEHQVHRLAQEAASVVTAAAESGIKRVVYASSAAVYGDSGTRPYREHDMLLGRSPYALMKMLSEQAVERQATVSDVATLSLRIFNVFGPGCTTSLVNRLVEGPAPLLAMSAEFVRDYVHVDDVAGAILTSCARRDVTGVLNVATGIPVDNLQLAALARLDDFASGAPLSSYSVGDPTAVHELLSWSPERFAVRMVSQRDLTA